MIKYGLLKYEENEKFYNVGDNIQSLAAKQFLPIVDEYINREKLADYKGEKIKLIMNGWFTHNIHNWIPSDNIEPLFVSFHLNNTAAPHMLTSKGVTYLKKHEPIGCRDQYTADTLNEKGIEAYFTGCLTLTLDSYKVDDSQRTNDIYIVDPLYGYTTYKKVTYNFKRFVKSILNGSIFSIGKRKKHLKQIIDKSLLDKAIYVNQEPPANTHTTEEKFAMAEDLLKKYAKAKLVITSRIHCALPCLAMGTPVIFVNGFDSFVDSCRFEGILELFNRIDVNSKTGEFKANFKLNGKITEKTIIKNFEKHHSLAKPLKEKCMKFISKK
ncbi:polysaccharide pyruvyl transferase family protein [Tenacibaculum retecalamus]|uniref:polysaccharide pyruvyl transferase family protein n=1 Tax=Tenacibaculum retecalamus TaxID=3018315 RepID=UPI0023D95FB4|nr:polysaccharide pyruvyl transferase family protein [Tenacibaculum retecalamus]WBX70736.1 polysaccharide pyruvyl transferase family protein [Tenacibaculum retecalamus]